MELKNNTDNKTKYIEKILKSPQTLSKKTLVFFQNLNKAPLVRLSKC